MSEKSHEKTEDELKSKIYEIVKKLSATGESSGYVHTGRIKEELPDIDEDTLKKLIDELVSSDRLVTLKIGSSFTFYAPKKSEVLKEKEREKDDPKIKVRLTKKTRDYLKSKICDVVEKLSAEDKFCDYAYLEQVVKKFPNINEKTLIKLLNELVFCDGKLVRIDGDSWFAYMPK